MRRTDCPTPNFSTVTGLAMMLREYTRGGAMQESPWQHPGGDTPAQLARQVLPGLAPLAMSEPSRAAAAATVKAAALHRLTRDVFVRAGMAETDAAIVADVLVWADLRGADSHGVSRITMYLRLIDDGDMNLTPSIKIRTETSDRSAPVRRPGGVPIRGRPRDRGVEGLAP